MITSAIQIARAAAVRGADLASIYTLWEAADTLRLACQLAAPSACTYRDGQSVAALGLARVLRDREWAARCVRAIHTAEYALSDASGSRVVSLEAAVLSPAEAQGLR